MTRKKMMGIVGCSITLMFAAMAWTSPVPDTGQTKCYDITGKSIKCPSFGEDLYGQDGNYSINSPSYTKLDHNGKVLDDSATSWVMVQDNVTTLIWEVKTNNDGVTNYNDIHDSDNIYTWFYPDESSSGIQGNGTDTQDFIESLNISKFGGYNDWRLPSAKELNYLINYNSLDVSINKYYFPNTAYSKYWSSTTLGSDSSNAFYVDFASSYSCLPSYFNEVKSKHFCVRAVRGKKSQPIYVDNGNGTVTDSTTGLMWQQATPDGDKSFKQALNYCKNLNLGGHEDWRLPSFYELLSLVDFASQKPSINKIYFPDTPLTSYWSSTICEKPPFYFSQTLAVWVLYFIYGGSHLAPHTGALRFGDYILRDDVVRAVRGGQNRLLHHLYILEPTQGEFLQIGTTKVLKWETSNIPGDIDIYISRDGGKNFDFIATSPNTGSWTWGVQGQESSNCMLKILPKSNPSKGTINGLFSIFKAPAMKGDLNADGSVNLKDAKMAFWVMIGQNPAELDIEADVNNDKKIGIAELVYIIQMIVNGKSDNK